MSRGAVSSKIIRASRKLDRKPVNIAGEDCDRFSLHLIIRVYFAETGNIVSSVSPGRA